MKRIAGTILAIVLIFIFIIPGLAAVDDSYSVVLLHMNGADTSTTFTDESGKTWATHGDAQIDTDYSIFGGASGLFDGTGDYLSTDNSSDFDFGTGDWTIDFWIRTNGNTSNNGIISAGNFSPFIGWSIFNNGSLIGLSSDASGTFTTDISYTFGGPPEYWRHVAFVRYGNILTLYVNGASEATLDVTGYIYNSGGTGAAIGRHYINWDDQYYSGYLDEIRVSKGIARWTENFTSPGEEYGETDTPTFTPSSTYTETFTPSLTPTYTSTNTQTFTPTFTSSRTPTFTTTSSYTFTPSNTPTETFTPTITFTPTASRTPIPAWILTGTYEAAYTHYLTVAQKNLPNVIVLSILCGIILLALLAVGVISFQKRRR